MSRKKPKWAKELAKANEDFKRNRRMVLSGETYRAQFPKKAHVKHTDGGRAQ